MPMVLNHFKTDRVKSTCGTRVSEDAARCLVCGTDSGPDKPSAPPKWFKAPACPRLHWPAGCPLPLALFLGLAPPGLFRLIQTGQLPGRRRRRPTATVTKPYADADSPTPETSIDADARGKSDPALVRRPI
jgi:hypothetical protein